MALDGQNRLGQKLTGHVIVNELLRNMELGAFEMAYTTLLPCIFHVYLHPEDHAHLAGVFDLIAEDARRALSARVAALNQKPRLPMLSRRIQKEHRIAAQDWVIRFFADNDEAVPPGDVEIHSDLSETPRPGFKGIKTTLIDREPGVFPKTRAHGQSTTAPISGQPAPERIYADIRYEDDTGPQVFLVTQNQVRIGRGAEEEPMDLALYTNDEVSREHLVIRRDAATGQFSITDKSTNGTWVEGRRIKRETEQPLPDHADIGVAEVLTLTFQVRK